MSNQVYANQTKQYVPPGEITTFTLSADSVAYENASLWPAGGSRVRFDRCNGIAGITIAATTNFNNALSPSMQTSIQATSNSSGTNELIKGLVILIKKTGTYVFNGTVVYTAPGADPNVFYGTAYDITLPDGTLEAPVAMHSQDYNTTAAQAAFAQSSNLVRYLEAGSTICLSSYVATTNRAIQGALVALQLTQWQIFKLSSA